MEVDFTTIAKGTYSGYEKASQKVIDNQEQWQDLWQQHTSDTEPPPPVPQENFSRYMIVAVFAGEQPSSGYLVEIISVEKTDDESFVITVEYDQPEPGDLVQDVITYPYHIVRIPQINANKIVFEQA